MKTLLIIVVALLVIWLLVKRRQNQAAEKTATGRRKASNDTAYHAVSLLFAPNACNAAMELRGRRFLASAAPRIPLPECDAMDCQCRFTHYQDRRNRTDRRSVFKSAGYSSSTGKFETERRQGADRRADDDPDFF